MFPMTSTAVCRSSNPDREVHLTRIWAMQGLAASAQVSELSESRNPPDPSAPSVDPSPPTAHDGQDSFAAYLARRLVGDKRYAPGVPEEAAALAEKSDIVLSFAEFGLVMICILDREADASKRFPFSQSELVDVGRACLKYTGTLNGAKMPVGITLYEVGRGPPSAEDCRRLTELRRTFPGFTKVTINCFYLDTQNHTVFTTVPIQRLLQRVGYRGWLDAVLREPRKTDRDIFVADPALPSQQRRPIATIVLLGFLVAMFVVEHLAKVGDKGAGFLGVDAETLFALGGMNADAVLKNAQWYRTLAAALLHGDAFHLLLNGLALGLAGYLLESLLGRAWFISLFFLGGLGGSLMGLLANPSNIVSVGASGAVMGLLAAAMVVTLRFPPGATRTQIQGQLLQFLIPSLIPLATHRQGGRIDFAAHFGGAIVGGVAGYLLMKLWPRTEEQPRFQRATTGLAVVSVACFGLSLWQAKTHYSALAAEATFSVADLLVHDAKIPSDVATAKREVESWGRDRPRDPRVHFYRALRLLDEENAAAAERELRAALAEREILDRAFGNKKFEIAIRSVLCDLLVQQGKSDEAKQEARPVCEAERGSGPMRLRERGLCD
jgi:rhomboid protease GluP